MRCRWNNKSQPSNTIGFYKIRCRFCGQDTCFIIDERTITAVRNAPLVKKILRKKESFVANKITNKLLGYRCCKP